MRASLKLIGINLLFGLLLFFASSIFANQIIFDKSELNNDFNEKKYISEIGDEKNLNFLNLFNKKKSKDIENLLSIIPTKNSNPVVQDLILKYLLQKKIDKSLVSSEEDNQIFELYISKLFDTKNKRNRTLLL